VVPVFMASTVIIMTAAVFAAVIVVFVLMAVTAVVPPEFSDDLPNAVVHRGAGRGGLCGNFDCPVHGTIRVCRDVKTHRIVATRLHGILIVNYF
jgi:hypothetical protein